MRSGIALGTLLLLAAGAAAQTPPTIPPSSAPQIAPKPAQPQATPAPVTQLQSEFAIAVGDTVLFPYQSKELTARSMKILDNQAKWLIARSEVKVTLEAYCDDDIDPAKATEFCLSRAREVRNYLVKQGVASERMALVAFDDSKAPHRKPPAETGKPGTTKPEAEKADASKKDKSAKKDEKARRTNRRVATRVSL
jgi:outer membrane protein OmpA-like peptidoglycan-associated protein